MYREPSVDFTMRVVLLSKESSFLDILKNAFLSNSGMTLRDCLLSSLTDNSSCRGHFFLARVLNDYTIFMVGNSCFLGEKKGILSLQFPPPNKSKSLFKKCLLIIFPFSLFLTVVVA